MKKGEGFMRAFIKDVLFGVLMIVLTMMAAFIVTLPFSDVADESNRVEWAALINREFLLTALPTAAITFLFAALLKTKTRREAVRRASVWTGCLALFYVFIGVNNRNIDLIFGTIGIYALLLGAFLGPVLYTIKNRQG
jgi:hypothetical protein